MEHRRENGDRQSDRRFLAVRNDLRRWCERGDLPAFCFLLREMRKQTKGMSQCAHWLVHSPPGCAITHSSLLIIMKNAVHPNG